ncbi:hypothetical protein K3495_g16014, partial [Podosphaera aphanis]
MTHAAGLPAEFWCFAAETDAHVRNRLARGPLIKGNRTSPEEAYTGHKQVSDHLKVWGCVCYVHVDPKTIPAAQLHNKQVDRGREAVFLGYSDETNKQYWYYAADLGYAQRSTSVEFDENKQGGRIDLRLRNLPSGVTGKGTPVNLIDRKPRGRPRKYAQELGQAKECSYTYNDSPIPLRQEIPNIISSEYYEQENIAEDGVYPVFSDPRSTDVENPSTSKPIQPMVNPSNSINNERPTGDLEPIFKAIQVTKVPDIKNDEVSKPKSQKLSKAKPLPKTIDTPKVRKSKSKRETILENSPRIQVPETTLKFSSKSKSAEI